LYTQDMIQFSQNLLDDAKDYFGSLYGREISNEEAESFLMSLLNFYNSLSSEN